MEKNRYTFVSYSSKNQSMADALRQLLIEEHIPCWMAPYDIPAGSKYAGVINDALESCGCVLLLLTQAAQESNMVTKEIERAVTYKKPVIPLKVEELVLNSNFKFLIGDDQIIAIKQINKDQPQTQKLLYCYMT